MDGSSGLVAAPTSAASASASSSSEVFSTGAAGSPPSPSNPPSPLLASPLAWKRDMERREKGGEERGVMCEWSGRYQRSNG